MLSILLAILLAFIAASLSDWLFMGVLFHERYKRYPEIWRDTSSETRKIVAAQVGLLITSAAFVGLYRFAGPFSFGETLLLAAFCWAIGPLPLLFTNHLFIKFDPLVTVTHALGWLSKLLLIAAVTALLIH